MHRRVMLCALSSIFALGLAGGVVQNHSLAADPIVMNFHHDMPEDTAQHQGAVKFKELVEQKTHGRIKVQVYANNALGDDVAALQQMQLGAIQGGVVPTAKLSNFDKAFQIPDLPFLFPTPAVAHEALDSEVGSRILGKLDAVGLKGTAFWESGFKQFICNHEVHEPTDFTGRKVRVMESPLLIAQYRALGANPIPIAFSETYTALQQGVVECQEQPIVTIAKMKFYEVQDYITLSNHGYLGMAQVFSKSWFDGLDGELQQALIDASLEAGAYQREQSRIEYDRYLGEIVAAGSTKTLELSDSARQAFIDTMEPVYADLSGQIGPELIDAMRAKVGELSH